MKECLAIYDVRGIQDYIFKTNTLKEIIGASHIVDVFLLEEFKSVCESVYDRSEIIIDWKGKEFNFSPSIQVEVLYYGGGNLVVAFKDKQQCEKINQSIAKSVIKKYYGLSIAFAIVDKTDNFERDYSELRKELDRIKVQMPLTRPAGNLSITLNDPVTGAPLSKRIADSKGYNKITVESQVKLENAKYADSYKQSNDRLQYELSIDNMRTNDSEGLVAIVHIDGNNMGMNIKNRMKGERDYKKAVKKIRELSANIQKSFVDESLTVVERNIPEFCNRHGVSFNKSIPYRRIIAAGDDITFVCNARIALDIVISFLKEIGNYRMYQEALPFSACAGMSIVHAHFPFSKGYVIAEECCDSAKKRAKKEGLVDGIAGNFIDFQYCFSGVLNGLEEMRERHYYNINHQYLLKRPYGVYTSQPNENYDIESTFLAYINGFKGISRSWAKRMRDAYYQSEGELQRVIKLYASRHDDFVLNHLFIDDVATYYDALEFMDLFGGCGE